MALFNNWHKMMKTNMWISGQGNLSNIIKQHVLNRSIVVFQKHQYAMFIQLFVWFFKLKDIFWSSKFDLQKTRIETDLLLILWKFSFDQWESSIDGKRPIHNGLIGVTGLKKDNSMAQLTPAILIYQRQ